MSRGRILIAGNSPTQAEHLRRLLEDAGYDGVVCTNGAEALEAARQNPPDAIVSAAVMPEMDGYAFCSAARSTGNLRDIPFLLVTPMPTPADILLALESGADGFIRKPYTEEVLRSSLDRFLGGHGSALEVQESGDIHLNVEGKEVVIAPNPARMLNALMSVYDDAYRLEESLRTKQQELEDHNERLKVAEQELRRSQEETQSLIQGTVIGVYRAGHDGTLLMVNPALASMLGYDSERELMEVNLRDLFVDQDEWRRFPSRDSAGPVTEGEVRWKRRDSTQVVVRLSVRVLPNDVGEPLESEGFVADRTEKRMLAEPWVQAQKMEAVGLLAGGISHDFNNLLTVITGRTILLERKLAGDEPLLRHVGAIARAASAARDLTRQLLAFSRRQVLEEQVVDVHETVTGTEEVLHSLIREDIDLRVQGRPESAWAKVDPGQLSQAVINLVANARDAINGGGQITVSTQSVEFSDDHTGKAVGIPAGAYVELAVSDTGSGMDPGTVNRVFDPFYSTRAQGKGTGLGLAAVYGIVTQSKGFILVDSELGSGSTFRIYLPAVAAPSRPLPSGDATVAQWERRSETILVVEDQDNVRELVTETLQDAGYSTIDVQNANRAMIAFQSAEGPIDLLLTDVVMPGMNGFDLYQSLAEVDPDLKVLYMSGHTSHPALREGIFHGELPFIQKPFTPEDLARKVRGVLDRTKARTP